MSRDRFPVVVHVLLLRGGTTEPEVFLLRRSRTGFMDGYHGLPGGHLQAGEGLQAAAARECREETGVIPEAIRPLCVLPYRSGRHQGINMVFEGSRLSGEPGLGEPQHSDRAAWFAVSGLPTPVVPWLADVLALRGSGAWYRELVWE